MSINPVSYTQFARVRGAGSAPSVPGSAAATPLNNSREDLLTARDELLRLYDSLQRLAELVDVRTRFRLDLPDARSIPGLALDLGTTASVLASSEQVNASPMSFTPFGPAWSDGSTALLTIGGEYDGSHGSGDLTFEVRRPGIRGLNDLRIRVYDPQGNRIRNFDVRATDSLDQSYDLRNGLFATVGEGLLVNRDTATVQVNTSTGEVFNPDLPFNGTRNSNPNFQFYAPPNALSPIVDGAFDLNGQSIAVNANDTLTDVVNRINASGADITASYNAVTERIGFVQNSSGSQHRILVENDTSNLVAATKLDTAVMVPGVDPESGQALQNVTAFAGISNGSFSINNTAIRIDRSSDSLVSVIDRINNSGAGVAASFDTQSQQVLIESSTVNSPLEIDSNGTGLFAALNIPEGRLDPESIGGGISRRRSYAIADELEVAFAGLNTLFRDRTFQDGGDHTGVFRNALAAGIAEIFGNRPDRGDELFGIRFDRSNRAKRQGAFASLERRDLTTDLQRRGGDVKRLLAGRLDQAGLIEALGNATVLALKNIGSALGQPGSVINTFA